ncbi:pentatricopeptide repeat-containing protein At1g10910, chloroplastic [Mercurialis annua]|uniref:pentatricopeptide repeat-containing protein At1g10910, chloroplastic n=1 Tax=Mercurialis annua TaxID=3986 RepID=UPI00215F227A|nr:pentatricopeptide repeat-containing protein At1g10910, chloroplastic [Mercurialis annua]XP_050232046.1 pentatricopeptide repeat-containing protein At1g10910, chloroplastic [Mercurialis annua]XP_055961653.1 pentatricopeptide repeat-containing protein At1g10910, chloroplastic [Mercurialis annua]
MELSVVQCHNISKYFNSPLISSLSASAPTISRTKKSQLTLAVASSSPPPTTIHRKYYKNSNEKLGNGEYNAERRHSKSYLARQAAIQEVQQSPDLDSALQRLGGILKAQDLNVILRTFGKQRRWQDLSKIFDWMKKHDKVNVSSYSSYLNFMGKSLNPVKALEFYNDIPDESTKTNVFICNSVLNCLVKSGKFDSSLKLFHKMKQDGLKPDAITYSTLLSGCMKVKHGYSKALDFVQELKYNGLQMDSVMYGTLLAVCASNNLCEVAESYFNQMKDEGHSPNVFHYSSLLNAYTSSGNYKKADELMEDMKSVGLVPNKVIWTTLLKVYVRAGLFEKSRELLLELETLGHTEHEMPYCILMDGLSKSGLITEARSVFDEMKEKGVKSDGYAHSIMISAYCRGRLLEEAKQLAKEFETQYDKYDLVILNTMLAAYCRAGDIENVMQTMRKMDEVAISPSYNTFHILIKFFCKQKLYPLAYRTMKDMHRNGHQPEEELCSLLIFHLGKAKAHEEAFSVYTMLKYGKRTMCKALHEKILHILIAGQLLKEAYVVVKDNSELISQAAIKKFANSFMRLGNINLINDVMKAIHSSGYKIDQELFQMAISRYIAEPEKKDLLLQLLQWMPGQGYAVDSSTRNLILKNSHLFGRQLIAEILSKQHTVSKTLKSL